MIDRQTVSDWALAQGFKVKSIEFVNYDSVKMQSMIAFDKIWAVDFYFDEITMAGCHPNALSAGAVNMSQLTLVRGDFHYTINPNLLATGQLKNVFFQDLVWVKPMAGTANPDYNNYLADPAKNMRFTKVYAWAHATYGVNHYNCPFFNVTGWMITLNETPFAPLG